MRSMWTVLVLSVLSVAALLHCGGLPSMPSVPGVALPGAGLTSGIPGVPGAAAQDAGAPKLP